MSESTLVKIPHCWKSHATAHLISDAELKWLTVWESDKNTQENMTKKRSPPFPAGDYKALNKETNNSYTMGCPPVRGDNPRTLAS